MERMLFVLAVSLGSVGGGYLSVRLSSPAFRSLREHAPAVSKYLKLLAIFFLNPIPIVNSFWTIPLNVGGLVALPILGVVSMFVLGGSALLVNHLFRIPPGKAASVFVAGMFTNIISFGGLTVYMFFGMQAYGLLHLYNMLIPFCYYAVGFPVSKYISVGGDSRDTSGRMFDLDLLRNQPYLFIPIVAMIAGTVLNAAGVAHWPVLDSVSGTFIPLLSGMLGFAIGITLRFGKVKDYLGEITLISLVKFVISPLIMIPLGIFAGLPHVLGGLPFYVLVVVSVMPVAFNALVPPALYGFDLDLANSAWVVTTLALLLVVPLLYFVLPT